MVSASFSVEKFSLLENRGSRHNDISSEICFLMFLAGIGVGIERIVVMEWRKRIRIGNPKRFTGMLTRLCHTHYGIKLGILQKNLDRCIDILRTLEGNRGNKANDDIGNIALIRFKPIHCMNNIFKIRRCVTRNLRRTEKWRFGSGTICNLCIFF